MSKIYHAIGNTLVEQYRDVGVLFGKSIRASVYKIVKKQSKLALLRRKVAEQTLMNLRKRRECTEFCQCLAAWSEGAGIKINEAMWLLADNLSGCQTMMVRYGSGVALLHSEEEFIDANHIELHMTSPHTIAFKIGGTVSNTLVYNDLLPGAGLYGWKKDLIVAVDSLFLKEEQIGKVKSPLLANIVSWLIWRMKPSEADSNNIVKLIDSLGELVDGYVINVVRKVAEKIEGYKITFARDEHHLEYLGDKAGDYLRQVNIIDPQYPKMKWTLPPKNIWRGGWKFFLARLKTMDRHAKEYAGFANLSLDKSKIMFVHQTIQKTIFGDLCESYINPDLGAVCIGLVDQAGTSVSVKLNDDQAIEVLEYTDQL